MEHEKELESGELLEQRLDKSETRRAEEVEKLTQDLNKQTRRVRQVLSISHIPKFRVVFRLKSWSKRGVCSRRTSIDCSMTITGCLKRCDTPT